jgi:hypothetical protein
MAQQSKYLETFVYSMRCIELKKYYDNNNIVDRIFFTLDKLMYGLDFDAPNIVELVQRLPWTVKKLNILKRFIMFVD